VLKHHVDGFYTQALMEAFTTQGGRLEALAQAFEVSTTWLCHPQEKLSAERYLALIALAKQLCGDEHFGLHIGQHMHASSFDVLGQALLKASTLGEALEKVLALEGLVHTLGHSQVIQEPGYVRVLWRSYYQLHPLARELAESVLAGIICFSQLLAGRPIPVMETTFVHSQPQLQSMAEYQRICRSRCYFEQDHNSILVADEVLAWPIEHNTSQAHTLFTPNPDRAPQSSALAAPLSHQLSHYLSAILADGNPKLSRVAKHFNMNPRTLQRRLEKEGRNYQQLLNQVRCRLAEDYLCYSAMSALEVSQLLGFKEQSSFNHFFVEQFGITPSEFRHSKSLYL